MLINGISQHLYFFNGQIGDMVVHPHIFFWSVFLFLILVLPFSIHAQPGLSSKKQAPKTWIFEGSENRDEVIGVGIADYSSFNPEKSWNRALKNGIEDLNANYSLLVYHYGSKVGQGPLRTESEFAIRSFLDSAKVSVVDSTQWKGKAFVLVQSTTPVPDSVLYANGKVQSFETDAKNTIKDKGDNWIEITGSTPRVDSNWHMSITKAKQDALRGLAEDLAVKVTTETYKKAGQSRSYYNFSTIFAFQRIHVLKRVFNPDSVKVEVAVNLGEIKMLLE